MGSAHIQFVPGLGGNRCAIGYRSVSFFVVEVGNR